MLKKQFRLTKKDDIARIIKDGKSVPGKFFLRKALKNGLEHNRYTVVISKKVDKRATKRNKCRRRIYEAIRNNLQKLNSQSPKNDIVLLVNKSCLEASYHDIEKEILHI